MDEQTTATQQTSYDISSDGAAVSGYEEEPLQVETPSTGTGENDDKLAPDGVALDGDGNVSFGEEFFGDLKDSPEETQPEQPAAKGYTDEELDSIPFQQWDLSRLNGDVGRYARKVQEQLQRTQAQASAQRFENVPLPPEITEVKPYTPKELSQEALKLACEKLGIGDTEDFDSYEMEHRAAYELAAQELIQRRQAEIAGYQTANQTWAQNNRYQGELVSRPDFGEFNNWVEEQCRQRGTTLAQLNAGLYNTARQNGNNFMIVPQFIEGLYREFQQTKQSARPNPANHGIRQIPQRNVRNSDKRRPIPAPAVLEGTQGNTYTGRPSITARAFQEMDDDQQADALMKLGIV